MGNVKIGRYEDETLAKEFAGWIEPEDRSWIIYLDSDGKPCMYYPQREPDGAVIGEGLWISDATPAVQATYE